MKIRLSLAALVASSVMISAMPAVAQDPPQDTEPVQLEDVTVTGRTLDQLIGNFVEEVAEPNRDRGLATWDRQVCVAVANLTGELAQYLVDRVSSVAEDLDLAPGGPGCEPNILIVATADGEALARSLVAERPRAFRMGGSGMDRGRPALLDFQEADRPVRWWQMSAPVDSDTGMIATRVPGACSGKCDIASDFAPQINVFAASRLRTQIVDRLLRTVVIVDVDDVSRISAQQLADYVAMISLAQIDPDADTQPYMSILNVFQEPETTQSLTDWDIAYLEGLYGAQQNARNRRSGRGEVQDAIRRAHRRMTTQNEG